MRMFQETLGGLREPTQEDVYCPMDLVVELTRGRNVEETVEQSAVCTPEISVIQNSEGPSTSHPEKACQSGYGRVRRRIQFVYHRHAGLDVSAGEHGGCEGDVKGCGTPYPRI